MNSKLAENLEKFPQTLTNVKDVSGLIESVVGLERLVLKSNYEDRQSGNQAAYERREFEVGGPNTRGLSWKLALCRVLAEATFCKMVRTGVHGGGTVILGRPENIDITIKLFTDLTPVYDELSKTVYTETAEGASQADGATPMTKAGWISAWLLNTPLEMATAIKESREKDASSNQKIAAMISEAEAGLMEYEKTLEPIKVTRAPKASRPRRAAKAEMEDDPNRPAPEEDEEGEDDETENGSENGDSGNTPDEQASGGYPTPGEYPGELTQPAEETELVGAAR